MAPAGLQKPKTCWDRILSRGKRRVLLASKTQYRKHIRLKSKALTIKKSKTKTPSLQ